LDPRRFNHVPAPLRKIGHDKKSMRLALPVQRRGGFPFVRLRPMANEATIKRLPLEAAGGFEFIVSHGCPQANMTET
jgi:hypothetical protein